jgi:shikimate kinase
VSSLPLITVARQYGTDAPAIGACLARTLAVPLYDREVLTWAAQAAQVSEAAIAAAERDQSLWDRVVEGLSQTASLPGDPAEAYAAATLASFYSSAHFRAVVTEVLRGIAATGPGVVIGHAAQIVLGDLPNVLTVFLHAPRAERIRRLVSRRGLTAAEAARRVDRSDADRTRFLRRVYHTDRYDLRRYALTINVAQRADDEVVAQIVPAVQQLATRLSGRC